MINLTGKTAIVTGGASGIGRATVLRLVEVGAEVFCVDLNEAGGRETAAMAADKVRFVQTDIADDAAIDRLVAEVRTRIEAPDIIANVAGWDKIQPFVDADAEFMAKVLAINLKGPMSLTKAFLPAMIARQGGKIVNVSSDAGRVGSMGETIYAGAKGGIIAFTKSLARETARARINVNCVCPGPTDTPLLAQQPEAIVEKLTRVIPFRRLAKPEEIADAIVFFASPMADYITGQVLSVSGGLTMSG